MARFRNISGDNLNVHHREGPVVKAGDVAIVDGEVVGELADAWIVGEGASARAWPKETWELLDPPPRPAAPAAAATAKKGRE